MPSEQRLSDVLSEFARTMVTDFPIQGILDQLVRRIVDILPITAAGVTLISPGSDPRYVAASDESALRFEQLQTELGEGPCLAAYQLGEAVSVPDLRTEGRFPVFTPRALAAGLVAVFTFPLRNADNQLGALDLYRDTPGPLDAEATTAAQTLADVAAAYLLNAQARADLQESSNRSRESAALARLSGDEFVILCEDLAVASEGESIAARVGIALAEPFMLSSGEVETTASIGIAFSGPADHVPEALLHKADIAMYQAKRKGGARHQVIDRGERRRLDERVSLHRDLRRACARGELRLEYQPIVTTTDGRSVGVEALVRWAHPSRGLISPAALIPLAEQSGLITEIGRWVLERACGRAGHGRQKADDLATAVNVSPHQLMSPDFTAAVEDVLRRTRTPPGMLTLEITESVFLQDSGRALVVLDDLKRLGVVLALDDFGTGYSSLSYLKRFPVDVVKIDKGFVADMGQDPASHAIVAAVVDLAHVLGLTVVAEGVETVGQHAEVAALGCELSQGYYFGRPMSADALDALMSDGPVGANPSLPALAAAS